MNILILSCGTRNLLVRYFRKSSFERIIVTDCSRLAPALYEADSYYIVPRMDDPNYITTLLTICKEEKIDAILPLQEDELTLLSENRAEFENLGVMTIVSEKEALEICRDKYRFYCHLKSHSIPALRTYESIESFQKDYENGDIAFPVFIKPIRGCGSIGAMKISCKEVLEVLCKYSEEPLLIQEYCEGKEFGADCYIDTNSHKVVDIFVKEKLRMRAGETEKSLTVHNEALNELILRTLQSLHFSGPVDMDIFEKDGNFYISEINPRFGGGYPHAYASGMNIPEYIAQNVLGKEITRHLKDVRIPLCGLKYSDIYVCDMNLE